MRFIPSLQKGYLLRRYKRFLADIETKNGEQLTIHCPNTGSMKNCINEGAPLWYSQSSNPKRKYAHTWEIATTPKGDLAGINTSRANSLVLEAIEHQLIASLGHYDSIRAEVPYGKERSRIDFVVTQDAQEIFVEVKNVTLCESSGQGFFPDAVSVRGTKHLRELSQLVQEGKRAMLIYCVQHSAVTSVAPAQHIDPLYAQTYKEALKMGVEVIALGANLSAQEITLSRVLPVINT